MKRLAALALVAVACAGCGGSKAPPAFDGTAIPTSPAAPNFTLDDQSGAAVRMAAQKGHYVVVTFLYTHCPDVCPVIAGMLNGALESSVGRRVGLRVLAVSVDPKGDTPAAVQKFIHDHMLVSSFRYLTGTQAELRPVWNAYHVASTPGPSATVSHSAIEYLIDPQGRERLIYDSTVTTAQVVHDLAILDPA